MAIGVQVSQLVAMIALYLNFPQLGLAHYQYHLSQSLDLNAINLGRKPCLRFRLLHLVGPKAGRPCLPEGILRLLPSKVS